MTTPPHTPIPHSPPHRAEHPPDNGKPISLLLTFFLPFGLLFLMSVLVGIVVNWLGLSTRWFVSIVQILAVILPTILLFRLYGRKMGRMTAPQKLRALPLIGLLLFSTGLVVLSDTVMHKAMDIAPTTWAESFRNLLETQAALMQVNDAAGYVWYFSMIVFGAGIFEELLFRGLILQASLQKMSGKTAIALNGFLFGVMHQDPIGFFFYFLFGAALAYVARRTGSLIYGMILHSALNWSAMIVARHYGALERLPIPVWLAVFGGLAAMGIGFGIFGASTRAETN